MLTNAHLHFKKTFSPADFCGQAVCFCAGSAEEWETATAFVRSLKNVPDEGASCNKCALVSAGIHPWSLVSGSAGAIGNAASGVADASDVAEIAGGASIDARPLWLEKLLANNADDVAAVGECGIDLYTPELKTALPAQIVAFEKQMELAARYEKPLVVHCRRSIQYFFEYAPRLKKLPSVIFHAFPGTFSECESLLKRGINAYFSFGGSFSQKEETRQNGKLPEPSAGLIRGGKHAAECVERLPDDRLLLETDAVDNAPSLLRDVFGAAAALRGVSVSELESVCSENFSRAYCV